MVKHYLITSFILVAVVVFFILAGPYLFKEDKEKKVIRLKPSVGVEDVQDLGKAKIDMNKLNSGITKGEKILDEIDKLDK